MGSYVRTAREESSDVEDGVGTSAPSHRLPLEVDNGPNKAPDASVSEDGDNEALLRGEFHRRSAWRELLYLAGFVVTSVVLLCGVVGGGVFLYLAVSAESGFHDSIPGHLATSRLNLSARLPDSLFQGVPRNLHYTVDDRDITATETVFNYNNFFEFSTDKRVAKFIGPRAAAIGMTPNPAWTVRFDGLTQDGASLDVNLATMLANTGPLEERLYRHRCVEAWSMVVPWIGFPLSRLLDMVPPSADAQYVRFESYAVRATASAFSAYQWPYVEALTLAEARNELAFVAVGIFQQPLPPQNGAPLRLVIPWKYGFKSIKTIVRISYTAERPRTFWEKADGVEYGFWANVNPDVPHPRWSQASEWSIPDGPSLPTKFYNGYAEFVEHLYDKLQDENLFLKR
ncbi:oxidoreductase [Klebsormidium nitens]|uniref:Oxidoreductase n=1 Tax=Klebsormidium nitens TaxID=105231 RepID=A0A1Y1IRZ5_KLENI|nr:oxidoreductase [Klebsormidium nitens]|eukprot:GAQ90908.1 oxidoreductase [Klebsormidium nitens]